VSAIASSAATSLVERESNASSSDDAPPIVPASDDRSLAARVQQGDLTAFDTLVRRHTARAYVLARRVLGDADEAEDLVQDAFIRALERIDTFDVQRAFAPWFFRLLLNLGLNARKSRALRHAQPVPVDAPSREDAPDKLAERGEIRERFTAALAALSPRQRVIVSLYEVDAMSSVDIARMLGVTQETVRWHLHQARRALRSALGVLCDDDR
jgi:RNA polymerase sigma-70 factor, ECF subfamily